MIIASMMQGMEHLAKVTPSQVGFRYKANHEVQYYRLSQTFMFVNFGR